MDDLMARVRELHGDDVGSVLDTIAAAFDDAAQRVRRASVTDLTRVGDIDRDGDAALTATRLATTVLSGIAEATRDVSAEQAKLVRAAEKYDLALAKLRTID